MKYQISRFVETLIKSQVEGAEPTAASRSFILEEGLPDDSIIESTEIEGLAQDGWGPWRKMRQPFLLAKLVEWPKNFDLHRAFVEMSDCDPILPKSLRNAIAKELKLDVDDNNFVELKQMGNFLYPWVLSDYNYSSCTVSTERSEPKGEYVFEVLVFNYTYNMMLYDTSKVPHISKDAEKWVGPTGARWYKWNHKIEGIYRKPFHLQLVSSNKPSGAKVHGKVSNDDKSEELER